MIDLFVNQIWLHKNDRHRILYINPNLEILFWIVVDDSESLPMEIDLNEFIRLVNEKEIILDNQVEQVKDSRRFSEKSLARWEKNWQIIEKDIADEPAILLTEVFNRTSTDLASKHNISRQTVRRLFIRYWKNGKSKASILPDYDKSGARGKERKSNSAKRGRPNIVSTNSLNVDDKIKKIIQAAYKKYFLKIEQSSLNTAYLNFLRVNFKKEVESKDLSKVPSLSQFKYWGEKKFNREQILRAKYGNRIYDKDLRLKKGSSLTHVIGPGSLYQIDSTKSDIELVSELDRSTAIGSPTLYIVSDTFSRMIVGILVTLENPSYKIGSRALYNSFINKVQFCKDELLFEDPEFRISEKDWPCNAIPERVVADRAELLGHQSSGIVELLGITLENTPAYRPDLKPVVENHFKLVHKKLKGVDGNIGMKSTNHHQRGVRNARLDAIFTLKEYYRIIVKEAIVFNKSQYLEEYPLDEDMVMAKLRPIPAELWSWGINNRSGKLRVNNVANLKEKMLPKANGGLNREGLRFKNGWYDVPINSKINNRQLQEKKISVTVAYDDYNLSAVYMIYEGEVIECSISASRSPLHAGHNTWEIDHYLAQKSIQRGESKEENILESIESMEYAAKVIGEAKKEKKKKKPSSISAQKIRENKNIEKNYNNERIRNAEFENKGEAKVIPLKSNESFELPKKLDFINSLLNED